jgi:hypothetical protein
MIAKARDIPSYLHLSENRSAGPDIDLFDAT